LLASLRSVAQAAHAIVRVRLQEKKSGGAFRDVESEQGEASWRRRFWKGEERVSAAQAGERRRALHRKARTKQRQAGTFQVEREMKALPAKRPRRGKLRFRRSVFANGGVSAWARSGRNVVRLSVGAGVLAWQRTAAEGLRRL